MKIAILLCGHVRSWNKEHFLNTFPNVDVFIHTYNNIFGYHPFIQNKLNITNDDIKLTNSEIESYIGIDIKKIVIEDENNIINNNITHISSDVYSQFRKFKLCNQLRLEYESIYKIKYDLVIKTRFDISYSLTISEIINLATNPNILYISEGPSVYPCDQIFIGFPERMSFLADLLTSSYPYKDIKFSSHEWLNQNAYYFIRKMPGLITNIIRMSFN
jgi:hypothetical protein